MNRTTERLSFTAAGNARDRILNAFVALLAERGYEALRIADILASAGVGRTSFYMHFANKEALLRESVARLKSGLVHVVGTRAAGSGTPPLAFSGAFFRHVDSHRAIYHAIVGRQEFIVVSHHLRRMLLELVRDDLARWHAERSSDAMAELASQHVAGALWSVAICWIEQGASLPADEVDAHFRSLALPGLSLRT